MGTDKSSNQKSRYPDTIQDGLFQSKDLPSQQNFNRELLRLKAHWITDLFPDVLVVHEKTVSIIRNQLFTSFVETIPLRDIGRVVYINTPFFAGIQIIGKNTAHELHIGGLNKNQAIQAKQLLEGLILENSGLIEIPGWMETTTHEHRVALSQAGKDNMTQKLSQNKHSIGGTKT